MNDKLLELAYKTIHMSSLDLINTEISDVNTIAMLGIEGHGLLSPFSVGGQFIHSRKNQLYKVILEKTFSFCKGGMGGTGCALLRG
ncbi:MAG: hypothetical protein H6936_15005 [Burkholderiales bacterium]|nr:hypothetical protein [Nitrosomonas sp.]MCP5276121.1 hypothetical protein [Burkholderiales bacterium]